MGREARIIDLTAPLGKTTPIYPGDPAIRFRRHSKADVITVTEITTGLHAGTHVDAPFHFIADGAKITDLPLSAFYGEAVCIDAPKKSGEDIGVSDVRGAEINRGDIVLFRTGWEERSGTPRFFQDEWPGIRPEAVEELARLGAKAIGGDTPSVDSPKAVRAGGPGHMKSLGLGMPIFESLVGLSLVAGKRFLFSAFPLKLADCEASPVRAVAILL
jgi:kynurenine formamidase